MQRPLHFKTAHSARRGVVLKWIDCYIENIRVVPRIGNLNIQEIFKWRGLTSRWYCTLD